MSIFFTITDINYNNSIDQLPLLCLFYQVNTYCMKPQGSNVILKLYNVPKQSKFCLDTDLNRL